MLDPDKIQEGDNVLINHPSVGSVWLRDVRLVNGEVEGMVRDKSVPEGESCMRFPVTCAWKRSGDPTTEEGGEDGQ